ncbi:type I-C CRISPR-associated protein Cas8c/Csd1 [Metabacillus sp. 84]|uniref:type I-C CRISPR-associated protein Cas8c/Csd1 n=1 Tax=Metabacillus sp. 84 TaxID=3404705 RepID=UPI003CF78658
MSWLLDLYETYEVNQHQVGKAFEKYNGQTFTLLPISHTTQNAHIEVEITEEGDFHSGRVLSKDELNTLIPSREDAASRAGSVVAPYPLHDKLIYVAGDYDKFVDGGKAEHFNRYIDNLSEWVHSPFSNNKVNAIYTYLKKATLIKDLVEAKILFLDNSNRLIGKWDKQYENLHTTKPDIFSVLPSEQESAFVRFNVRASGFIEKVWEDMDFIDSYILYYQGVLGESDICYVTGEIMPSTERHTNKIRNAGDKAKLISSNDKSGFTYRGRFRESKQAVSISYEVSQKAHNALKWLIQYQGKQVDLRVFLIWSKKLEELPDPLADPFYLESDPISQHSFTNKEFAKEVGKAISGYKSNLTINSSVNIMTLDAATPGRLAVLYYRNMDSSLYLERLKNWFSNGVWLHRFKRNDEKVVQFLGVPSPKEIAFAVYGSKTNDKVVKELIERLLPCIVDQKPVPVDITRRAVQRASNPVSMEKWEWEKTLSVACSLLNKKEEYEVALDITNNERDYLFGRLLAVADVLERQALGREETRATNAIRYMNAYSQHPARTWKTIQSSLQPYQAKMGTGAVYLSRIIDEIASQFAQEDFSDRSLSGKYLLGFYSQRHALYQKREEKSEVTTN